MAQVGALLNFADRIQVSALGHRLRRSQVLGANVANAQTPGFRALGYDFEDQLQDLMGAGEPLAVQTTQPRHRLNAFTSAEGNVEPEVYVRPTESVAHDGNTVDLDLELTKMGHNQILFRTGIETLTRKLGLLKYAIDGGR